jgi:hypothetical protein
MFKDVKPVTLFSSLKSFTFRLWDESAKKLVSFRHLKTLRKKRDRGAKDEASGSGGRPDQRGSEEVDEEGDRRTST